MSRGSLVRHGTSIVPEDGGQLAGADDVYEYLGFMIGAEAYALPLSSIREILKPPPVTEVPRAAPDVLGIISVRGRITTVIDMRRIMGMEPSPPLRPSRVLLVDAGPEVLGLQVDRVLSVFRLTPSEIEVHPSVGGDTAEYVVGVGRPRAAARGAKRARRGPADAGDVEMLILLDPVALLRR